MNKIRYIELLKKQERPFSNENPKEWHELLSYSIILEDQICYNRRAEYIFLVEEYLKKIMKIGLEYLCGNFLISFRQIIKL